MQIRRQSVALPRAVCRCVGVLGFALAALLGAPGCSDSQPATPDHAVADVHVNPPDVPQPLPDLAVAPDFAPDIAPDFPPDVAPVTGYDLPAVDIRHIDAKANAGLGDECDPTQPQCGAGLACCYKCCDTPTTFTCALLDSDGTCPAPDLFVDQQTLNDELEIHEASFPVDDCAIAEQCVNAPGDRRLLSFSTLTPNTGTADLVLGSPMNNSNFVYSQCHMHYHFVHYAKYTLFDAMGNVILTGRKQAFCLEDYQGYPDPNSSPAIPAGDTAFNCNDPNSRQGIHRGWADLYYSGLPCQYLDITDVPPGDYRLRVEVNPDKLIIEKDYSNNISEVRVVVPPAPTVIDPLTPCSGAASDENRECGWTKALTNTCTPGTMVTAGCNAAPNCNLGSCTGDPIMRICAGTGVCKFRESIANNDDALLDCGTVFGEPPESCPLVSFTCPSVGSYTVMTAPYQNGFAATCTVATMP